MDNDDVGPCRWLPIIVEVEQLGRLIGARTGQARRTDRVGARWHRGWPCGMRAQPRMPMPGSTSTCARTRGAAVPYGSSVLRHGHVLKRDGRFARCCAADPSSGPRSWRSTAWIGPLPMPTSTARPMSPRQDGQLRITRPTRPHHVRFRRHAGCIGLAASNPACRRSLTRRDEKGGPSRLLAPPRPYFPGIRAPTGARLPHIHRYFQRAGWRSGEPANYHAARLTTLLGYEGCGILR